MSRASHAATPARRGPLLLDTHTLIWSTEESSRLGSHAKEMIREAAREDGVLVSAITPWEIALLTSKRRLQLDREVLSWLQYALSRPGVNLVPLEPEIAVASTCLPFEIHSDPADRIIVATARHLGAMLVTADQMLLGLAKQGHLRALDASR